MKTYLLNVRSQFGHIEVKWLNLYIDCLGTQESISIWIPYLEVIERLINISTIYTDTPPGSDIESVTDDIMQELVDNHVEILAGVTSEIILHIEEIMEQSINRLMELDIFGGSVVFAGRLDNQYPRDDGFLLIQMQ